jgi:hypothetical protein
MSQFRQLIREEIMNEYNLSKSTEDKVIMGNVEAMIRDLKSQLAKAEDSSEKSLIKKNLDANMDYLKFLKKKNK